MHSQRFIESIVGLFLLFSLIAFTILAFKVSGLTGLFPEKTYSIYAEFDDIGGLKLKAPVKIGGVQIGKIEKITLDPLTYRAKVKISIRNKFNTIPDDSSAGIYTSGLLGDNYIAITPMYHDSFLKQGSTIESTKSAMVLEKLIGQFIYKIGNANESSGAENAVK